MNRTYIALALVFIFLLTASLQCGEDLDSPQPVLKYYFKEPVSVNPYQTYYKTGDTIWLTLDLPDKKLFDTISGTSVLFDSASFDISIQVQLEYNNPLNFNGPFVSFLFPDSSEGKVYGDSGLYYIIGNLKFGSESSPDYSLRLGIVLLKKGVFLVRVNSNQINRYCNCGNDYVLMKYTFNVNDTHTDFYKQIPFENVGQSPNPLEIQLLENKTAIVFQVD